VDAGLIWMEVDPPSATLRADFSLSQNYPNPFNPATTISYTLPVGGTVLLRVFALDGREIATLIHENQSAGTHQVGFDARLPYSNSRGGQASHLASGVYIYRLQLGGFAQVRKMLVIR
jgi:hypothetical protein